MAEDLPLVLSKINTVSLKDEYRELLEVDGKRKWDKEKGVGAVLTGPTAFKSSWLRYCLT